MLPSSPIRSLTSCTLLLLSAMIAPTCVIAVDPPAPAIPPATAAATQSWQTITAPTGSLFLHIERGGYRPADVLSPELITTVASLQPTYDVLHWRWVSRAELPTDLQDYDQLSRGGAVPIMAGRLSLPFNANREEVENATKSLDRWLDQIDESGRYFLQIFLRRALKFDLDFPGGDFGQWLSALEASINQAYHQQMPELIRPLMPPHIKLGSKEGNVDARVSPMKLKGSTLNMHSWFSNLLFNQVIANETSDQVPVQAQWARTVRPLSMDRWVFSCLFETLHVTYFNLGTLPERAKGVRQSSAEDLAALLEIRWQMESTFVWAKTRFHPETNMLIIAGTDDEILIADEVFQALQGKRAGSMPFGELHQGLDNLAQIAEVLKEIREVLPPKKPNAATDAAPTGAPAP